MSEIDYVIPGLVIKQKAVIDLGELCDAIKDWLKLYKYLVFEKEYREAKDEAKDAGEETGKEIYLKLVGERKIDDYTKFVIEAKIKTTNLLEVYVKRRKLAKCEVSIKLEAYMIKDYENIWEERPFAKFLRGVYDRFILMKKFSQYAEEITNETYKLHSEIKRYLNALIVEA